jgi:hypothetical protein
MTHEEKMTRKLPAFISKMFSVTSRKMDIKSAFQIVIAAIGKNIPTISHMSKNLKIQFRF